jgi:hypothetical protein
MRNLVRVSFIAGAILCLAPGVQAQVFTASLSGPNEAPPVDSPGIGFATVTLDSVLRTMRVQITFSGLTGNTTVAHIHSATPTPFTGLAGVATQTPSFPGFPTGVTAGSYDQTFNMALLSSYNPAFVTANGGTTDSAQAALFNGIATGRAYVNVHTNVFPTGEIRGFLVAAPEPGALALIGGLGLVGLPVLARRRRVRSS